MVLATDSIDAQIARLVDGVCTKVTLQGNPNCSACTAKATPTGITYTCTDFGKYNPQTACVDPADDKSLCGRDDVCAYSFPKDDPLKSKSPEYKCRPIPGRFFVRENIKIGDKVNNTSKGLCALGCTGS